MVVVLQPLSMDNNYLSHRSHTERHGLGVTNTTGTSAFIEPSPSSLAPLSFLKQFTKKKQKTTTKKLHTNVVAFKLFSSFSAR